jgi:hypothetical protein
MVFCVIITDLLSEIATQRGVRHYFRETTSQNLQSALVFLYSFPQALKYATLSSFLDVSSHSNIASELYRPSHRRFSARLVRTFADRGHCVVNTTDPQAVFSIFWTGAAIFSPQIAPQLYSRGRVDPVPDPLLLRKSGSAGNGTRTSGSVARNPYH